MGLQRIDYSVSVYNITTRTPKEHPFGAVKWKSTLYEELTS
jgi:hypothetical protein